jgi:predicted transposase YdaD
VGRKGRKEGRKEGRKKDRKEGRKEGFPNPCRKLYGHVHIL